MDTVARLRVRGEPFRFMRPAGSEDITDLLNQQNMPALAGDEQVARYDDGTLIKFWYSSDMTYCDIEVNRLIEVGRGQDRMLEIRILTPEEFHWRE